MQRIIGSTAWFCDRRGCEESVDVKMDPDGYLRIPLGWHLLLDKYMPGSDRSFHFCSQLHFEEWREWYLLHFADGCTLVGDGNTLTSGAVLI